MVARSNSFALPRLIGVIHLPALCGAPRAIQKGISSSDTLQEAGFQAVREARLLTEAGFDGIILENFGDTPFYKDEVPPETIASMAIIAAAVRESTRLPIGINVLRNDARAALAIAAVSGCQFIRVNTLSGLVATDQGLIEGPGAFLLRERERLHAREVAILADVQVKHARTLHSEDVAQGVEEAGLRAMADGVIVTGSGTGKAVSAETLQAASRSAREHGIPLFIGSGAAPANLAELRSLADGVIVGSYLRKGGLAGEPLDPKRLKEFSQTFKSTKPGKLDAIEGEKTKNSGQRAAKAKKGGSKAKRK